MGHKWFCAFWVQSTSFSYSSWVAIDHTLRGEGLGSPRLWEKEEIVHKCPRLCKVLILLFVHFDQRNTVLELCCVIFAVRPVRIVIVLSHSSWRQYLSKCLWAGDVGNKVQYLGLGKGTDKS